MPFVMPEIIVRKLIDHGIKELRKNKPAFDDLFSNLVLDELNEDYGSDYREKIWQWFSTTKIPVVQAWSFNAQKIPCISIHLASETEDESKAALDDLGAVEEDFELGTAVFTTMIDVGIHTAQGGDYVLWMYYIVSYILFKHKQMAHRLGLKLQTYSASDYSKDADKGVNNVWTRWVRFRCTTQNFWHGEPLREFEHVNTYPKIGQPYSEDLATSLDVPHHKVDRRTNKGIVGEQNDADDDYHRFIDPDDEDLT
jgi:hypothetical protein